MNRIETSREKPIVTPEQYFMDPRVSRAILSFMGVKGPSWADAGLTSHAFIGVGTEVKALSGKSSPVSTINPDELAARIKEHKRIELYVSLRQKESVSHPGIPQKVMFLFDIDRFRILPDGNYDEASLIADPVGTFNSLRSTRHLYDRMFDAMDIPTLTVASGKGYHYFAEVQIR